MSVIDEFQVKTLAGGVVIHRPQGQVAVVCKGNESQITKWEEKYFRMCEKWQESENRVRELRKFEEKHLQMQSLIANLGNFMGGGFNPTAPTFHSGQEIEETSPHPFSFDHGMHVNPLNEKLPIDLQEEKYNLFGMRQPLHRDE